MSCYNTRCIDVSDFLKKLNYIILLGVIQFLKYISTFAGTILNEKNVTLTIDNAGKWIHVEVRTYIYTVAPNLLT